jgi:AraC-like DNA-binding protein
VESLISLEQIHLDPALTIDILAERTACTRHSLSQVLNECKKLSFYDYINSHRVATARSLLADESKNSQKIASIAYDAGFNYLSTFNEVFKKITGCTPSQFRRYPAREAIRQRV